MEGFIQLFGGTHMKTYNDCNDNFVLYDLETSGTSRGYDQLLQCGALLTNGNLDVVDRLALRCRRLAHVVPAPDALLVTNTDPAVLEGANLSHYDLVRQTFLKFKAWSPATFCAHNGISFDELMLRSALYQTLHSPYVTQTEGNQRIDSMLLARGCAILAPGAISIPEIDGKFSFKLGELARANGVHFPAETAHDANADVEAMRQILVRIKENAPKLFEMLVRGAGKKAVLDLALSHDYFRLSAYHSGKPVSRTVTAITTQPSNPNALAVFDAAHDPNELRQMNEDRLLAELTASPRKIRIIKINAFPIVSPVGAFPGEPTVAVPAKILAERAHIIKMDQDFQQRVAAVMERHFGQKPAHSRPEDQIYDGFPSRADEALCRTFHAVRWEERPAILDRIQDKRLQVFGLRLLYAERPDLLSEGERQEMFAWQCDRILADDAAPWLSAPKALEKLAEMMKSAEPDVRRKLASYVQYIARIRSVATQFPHGRRRDNAA
jgi:exodeoxyribonuclease-1